jgi:hypothetical protein
LRRLNSGAPGLLCCRSSASWGCHRRCHCKLRVATPTGRTASSAGTGGKPTTICQNAHADRAMQRPSVQSKKNAIQNKAMISRTPPATRAALNHEWRKTDPFLDTHQTPDHSSLLKSYRESKTTPFGNPLCQHVLDGFSRCPDYAAISTKFADDGQIHDNWTFKAQMHRLVQPALRTGAM